MSNNEPLEKRVDDLSARVAALSDQIEAVTEDVELIDLFRERSKEDVMVGDEMAVVITDPNQGTDKDPFCRINGKACFVRGPEGFAPGLGERVPVRVADVKEGVIVAVAMTDEEDDG